MHIVVDFDSGIEMDSSHKPPRRHGPGEQTQEVLGGDNNKVPTIFYGQHVRPGTYSEHTSHYGILRTIEDMYGLAHAGASATAAPITDVWK
jgi:acid phosphatase